MYPLLKEQKEYQHLGDAVHVDDTVIFSGTWGEHLKLWKNKGCLLVVDMW